MGNAALNVMLDVLLAGFLATASMSQEKLAKRFELEIEAGGTVFQSGQEIRLKLTFRNESNKPVTLLETHPYCDYKWIVKGQSGKDASLTEFGRRMQADAEESRMSRKRLNAGERIQHEVPITRLYDLSRPGAYYVTAKRVAYIGESMTAAVEVVSNTVKLTIKAHDVLPQNPSA